MDNKKKFRGGLKVLLLLLFTMLLGIFSTCYAFNQLESANTLTVEEVTAVLQTFINQSNYYKNSKTQYLQEFINNGLVPSLTTSLNSILDSSAVKGQLVFSLNGPLPSSTDKYFNLVVFYNNNTIGNSLPFVCIKQGTTYNTKNYILEYIDESGQNVNFNSHSTWIYSNSFTSFYTNNSYTINTTANYLSWNNYINSVSGAKTFIPGVITFNQLGGTYYLSTGAPSGGNYIFYWNWGTDDMIALKNTSNNLSSGDDSSGELFPVGTITNSSGEVTGRVDLTNIENGIENINQNLNTIENKISTSGDMQTILSGEISKITGVLTDSADNLIDNTTITSGDIDDALGFEIAEDPYSNFWLTLTNNLKTALLGSKRSIDISFQGRTWTISLDEYLVLPAWLTIILIPFSTCFFTFMIVRQWKHIFDKLSSGNVDSILQENSEERNF